MKPVVPGVVALGLLVSTGSVLAHSEHEHGGTAMDAKEHGGASAAPATPSGAGAAQEHTHGKSVQEITIKGELVDSLCYVAMNAKGAGHKQCAMDCAKAGIPISMLEDGTGKLYTVLPKEDKTGYPASVISRMGETVTLKGDLYENGGQRYVTVESVE